MPQRILALTVLMFALFTGAAQAAGAGSVNVVDPNGERVRLVRDEGAMVRLDSKIDSVFVADAEIADVQVKSRRLVYIFGKKVGQTTLFAVGPGDNVVASADVVVRHDLGRLKAALRDMHPSEPIEVKTVEGAVVLTGKVSHSGIAEDAREIAVRYAGEENVINRLEVTSPTQVHIRVRVAEVERSISESIGVQWNQLQVGSEDTFSFLGGALTGGAGSFAANLTADSGDTSVDATLDLLADEGLVTVLAEPNLTALSGETATFLAGGEFPIPVSQDEDTISVEFREFGVRLEFTPTILNDGRISLKVAPEVSELNFADGVAIGQAGIRVPALNTRRTQTTVELASGQSFAIAGLLQNTTNHDISKLPGLGDLPVLGALFRSDSYRRGETELTVVITPYLVRPSESKDMALPTDGLTAPNDIERILFGRMYGERADARMRAEKRLGDKRLSGPVGFMLK
jgi:pilus assembly protein CpaC